MSRIGKIPVAVPAGVKITLADRLLTAEGPKGKAQLELHPAVSVAYDEAARKITVSQREVPGAGSREVRTHGAIWGTMRKLIANLLEGVSKGYTQQLQVVGVGYSAKLDGKTLVVRAGIANEIRVPIPEGLTVAPIEAGNIMITGIGQIPALTVTCHSHDKRLIGQFTSSLRKLRPPEPYKGKGIRYLGEEVKRKAGKALAAGAK